MARIKNNSVTVGLSGAIGDLIFKQYSYGTVASKRPDRSKVKLSKNQKAANQNFKHAVFYAKQVLRDPKLQKQYAAQVKKGKSLYHAALADYLKKHKPEAAGKK